MLAERLRYGDEIRVVAPARSLSAVMPSVYQSALEFLSQRYQITFSKHCREQDSFDSSSIPSRISDLHDAFSDRNVKAILPCLGGFNSNQLLEYLDYDFIRDNPKLLCGFSDITALLNAIYAKTGLVTYHGMMFSSFGFPAHLDYGNRMFENCVMQSEPFILSPSELGNYITIRPGQCEGVIVGGNLCTLNLLQGTGYLPDLKDKILFLEDDNIVGDYFLQEFDRNLQSLLQVPGADSIKGLVLGRFEGSCRMTPETVERIVSTKRQLRNVPILFHVDFGHVPTFATFPIGGSVRVEAPEGKSPVLQIMVH